jgi:nicotinate-nucleotide adenylyltransferase
MTGLLGGAFNPPHNGHVALARAACEHFDLDDLVVLVSARPGHKEVQLDADTRLRLAEAAFPAARVELDPHARTVDLLKEEKWEDPLLLIGADQFAEFLTWKDPAGVLERARVGVATRPGYPREQLEAIKNELRHGDRVEFFELDPVPISSRDIRERVARGEPIDDLVPSAVSELISSLRLYRDGGYTEANPEQELTQS